MRSFGTGVLDLRVYLAGGEAWLVGTDLYTADFHAPKGLPFTYPPFAAMVFSVLTPLPLAAAVKRPMPSAVNTKAATARGSGVSTLNTIAAKGG